MDSEPKASVLCFFLSQQAAPASWKSRENPYALLARCFAERYLDVPAMREVIELHDEAYASGIM